MERVKVDKFDGTEFQIWKNRILAAFELADCLEALDADQDDGKKPEGDAQLAKTRKHKQALAKTILFSGLANGPMKLVMRLKTVHEMWKRPKATYDRNPVQAQILLQEYHRYVKKPEDTMAEHIAKVEELIDHLEELG